MGIGKLLAATADLAEAEGRLLRAHLKRLGAGGALLVSATVVGIAGVALLMLGLYLALIPAIGAPGAAAVCGGACLVVAGALAWATTRVCR